MRTIPKRSATAHTHTVVSKEGKKFREEVRTRDILTDIEHGPATVQVTRGIKRWESNRDSGMSIETACSVTIPCASNASALQDANDYAAAIAHQFAWTDHKAIQEDLDRFVEWLENKK